MSELCSRKIVTEVLIIMEKEKKAPEKAKSSRAIAKTNYSAYALGAVQLIISVFLMVTLFRLDILPMAYFALVVVVLLALLAGVFIWMKKSRKKTSVITSRVLSAVLSFVLLFGMFYIARTSAFLNKVSGTGEQTYVMSVIVMKDSGYDKLEDLKGKTYGIAENVDKVNTGLTTKAISKKQGALNINKADDVASLADTLYDKSSDAIIVSESQRELLAENHKKFNKETKVIWKYTITKKMKDSAKRVDVTKDAFTIYISGIDTSGAITNVSRSDVNMLATVNPTTREIILTSIPRDYYVTLATSGQKDKLTHSGIYGVDESEKTVENLLGVDINYYVKVNFSSLTEIVDALGGVDVYSDKALSLNGGSIVINKGTNHMNGKMALAFSRERHSYAEGDNHRIKNQQEVVQAIIKKASSPAVLKSYSQLLSSVGGSIETNLSTTDIKKLAKMQLKDSKLWNITSIQLTGTGSSSTVCYSYPGPSLYVMEPNQASVKKANEQITAVVNGEVPEK